MEIVVPRTVGWKDLMAKAKSVYWLAREDGKSENEALSKAIDETVSVLGCK